MSAILPVSDAWDSDAANASVISTPSTLRGREKRPAPESRPIDVHLDWLSVTVPAASVPRVKQLIGGSVVWASEYRPKNGYRHCENHGAIRLFTDHRCGGDHAQLLMTGKVLSGVPFLDQLRLLAALYGIGGRASRVDLAFDDLEGRVTVQRVVDAWQSNEVVSHWRTASERKDTFRGGSYRSHSFTFGSRESASSLGVYQKGLQTRSDDYPEWVRWELRHRGKAADEVARELMEVCGGERLADLPEKAPAVWREHDDPVLCEGLNGRTIFRSDFDHDPEALRAVKRRAIDILLRRVDFRHRSTGGGNVTRASRVEWWEEYLEHVDPDPAETRRLDAELERADEEWRRNGCPFDSCYEHLELAGEAARTRKARLRVDTYEAPNTAFGEALAEYMADHPDFEYCPLTYRLQSSGEDDAADDVTDGEADRPAFRVVQGGERGPPAGHGRRVRPDYLKLVPDDERSASQGQSVAASTAEASICAHVFALGVTLRRPVGTAVAGFKRLCGSVRNRCSSGLARLSAFVWPWKTLSRVSPETERQAPEEPARRRADTER